MYFGFPPTFVFHSTFASRQLASVVGMSVGVVEQVPDSCWCLAIDLQPHLFRSLRLGSCRLFFEKKRIFVKEWEWTLWSTLTLTLKNGMIEVGL